MERVKLAVISSRMAYTDLQEGKKFADYKFDKVLKKQFGDYEIVSFVASHKNDTIISFSSNISSSLLFKEMATRKNKTKIKKIGDGVKIFIWFMDAYKKLERDTILPGGFQRDKTYLVTGHGFGGALASIFAFFMVNKRVGGKHMWSSKANQLITFGAPRVGNREFAIFHDRYIRSDQKLRFVHDNDIIPEFPPLERLYLHHSRKVSIVTEGKRHVIKVCGVGDSPHHCANKKPKSEKANKMQTYEKILFDTNNHNYYNRKGVKKNSFEETQCLLPKEDANLNKKKKKKVSSNSLKLKTV